MRVGIRDERQITHTFFRFHIGNITHPYFIGTGRNYVLDKVLVFMVMVAGVCRLVVPASLYLYHKSILTEQLYESVTTGHTSRLVKETLYDKIQLHTSETRVVLPVIFGFFNNQRFNRILSKVVVFNTIIERLPAITKQPGKSADSYFRTLFP